MSRLIANISAVFIIFLAASAVGLGLIIQRLDPTAGILNPVLFYGDLFILLFSLTFVIGFYSRRMLGTRELARKHFIESSRQSVWLAVLVTVSLLLLSRGYFNWINAVSLVFALIFLESYFLFK